MKKNQSKKSLVLSRETVRMLDRTSLGHVAGGATNDCLGGGGSQSGHYTCTCNGTSDCTQ
jgi:hypothetical protein